MRDFAQRKLKWFRKDAAVSKHFLSLLETFLIWHCHFTHLGSEFKLKIYYKVIFLLNWFNYISAPFVFRYTVNSTWVTLVYAFCWLTLFMWSSLLQVYRQTIEHPPTEKKRETVRKIRRFIAQRNRFCRDDEYWRRVRRSEDVWLPSPRLGGCMMSLLEEVVLKRMWYLHCRGEYAGQVEEEEDAQAKAEEAKDEVSVPGNQSCRSVTFWYGSGSSNPYLWRTDPDTGAVPYHLQRF